MKTVSNIYLNPHRLMSLCNKHNVSNQIKVSILVRTIPELITCFVTYIALQRLGQTIIYLIAFFVEAVNFRVFESLSLIAHSEGSVIIKLTFRALALRQSRNDEGMKG